VFETADPESAADLAPVSQISQSTQSTRLVYAGLLVCLIGTAWIIGATLMGVKNAVLQPLTTTTSSQL
jgi:hypothetical protein